MKRLHTALLVSGVAFLTYLVWTVGGGELWGQLRSLGWGVVPLVLLEGAANVAHTVGWRWCLDSRYRSISLVLLFRMAMAGFAINYLTPSASLGGEVTKAAWLASRCKGIDAASSVVLDKLCLAFAHLLCVVAGSLIVLSCVKLPPAFSAAMLLGTVALASGIVGFMLIQKHGKLGSIIRWLAGRRIGGRGLENLAEKVSAVDETLMTIYRERPLDLLWSIGWHLLGHLVAIVQVWLFFYLLEQAVPLTGIISAGFLGLWFDLFTFAIPLNLGTLEGSRIVALKAVGASALVGMTYGLAIRIALLFWAAFGLVSYGFFIWAKRKNKASAPWVDRAVDVRRQAQFGKPDSAR